MTRKVWTAAELEEMDPSEVDAIFEEGIIWDPAEGELKPGPVGTRRQCCDLQRRVLGTLRLANIGLCHENYVARRKARLRNDLPDLWRHGLLDPQCSVVERRDAQHLPAVRAEEDETPAHPELPLFNSWVQISGSSASQCGQTGMLISCCRSLSGG